MSLNVLNQTRSTIVGIGGFGLHALLHLAPRLRFANEQRHKRDPSLPDLRQLVTYVALMPDRKTGRIGLWLPRESNLQDLEPMELRTFWQAASDFLQELERVGQPTPHERESDDRCCLREAYERHRSRQDSRRKGQRRQFLTEMVNDALIERFGRHFRIIDERGREGARSGSGFPVTRRRIIETFALHHPDFADELVEQLRRAHFDRDQPIEDVTQLSVYYVASMADDVAGALVWPLSHVLRRHLRGYPTDQVGLLSTGAYSPPPYRSVEEAAVFANLFDLNYLAGREWSSDGRVDPGAIADSAYEGLWPNDGHQPAMTSPTLDRCYLFDSTKASGAGAADEHEAVVAIGNTLELFLVGNGEQAIQADLAAGISLDWRSSYSAVGAANKYLPVDALQRWLQHRFQARLLDKHMLNAGDVDVERWEEEGRQQAHRELGVTVEALAERIGGAAGLRPRRGGRDTPLPRLTPTDPEQTRWDPPGSRAWWRLPPAEWYRRLRQHHNRLTDPHTVAAGRRRLLLNLEAGTLEPFEVRSRLVEGQPRYTRAEPPRQPIQWLYAPSSPGRGVSRAIGVPWRQGYLAVPLLDARREVRDRARELLGARLSLPRETPTALDELRNRLSEGTRRGLVSRNPGLIYTQAWLRGVIRTTAEELERLPQDDRDHRAFLDRWWERRIALERRLAGQPGDTDRRPTHGLAQSRPTVLALLARGLLLAAFLVITVLGFIRLASGQLAPGATAQIVTGITLLSLLVAALPLTLYLLRAWSVRRQAIRLWQESLDHAVTQEALQVVESVLEELLASLVLTLEGIDQDVNEARRARDSINQPLLSATELSDTIFREAILNESLRQQVTDANVEPVDEKVRQVIESDGNLWRWSDYPVADRLASVLEAYGRNDGRTEEGSVWHVLRDVLNSLVDPYIKRILPYDLNIESYISQDGAAFGDGDLRSDGRFDAQAYLITMGFLAKPFMILEEHELPQPVVSANLLGVYDREQTRFDRSITDDLRPDIRWSTHPPQLVTTRDSFSLTYLRSLHGLPLSSMLQWERYRDAFKAVGQAEQVRLAALPLSLYSVTDKSTTKVAA